MTTILALDLGTTTGWAMLCDGTITSGSQSFKPLRFEGGGMRFLKFKRFLSDTKDSGVLRLVFLRTWNSGIGRRLTGVMVALDR